MTEVIKYSNGLRLIVDCNPGVRSVALGIWVRAGSVREPPKNNGISHFTEHVMFKGTDKYTAFDIANIFEGCGSLVNAFTGKEATCYYVKCVDEYAEKCFELLSQIFLHSSFDAAELDKERKVIIEEINMVEDSPEDICYDLIAETSYKGSPLGMTILGPIDNVKRFTRYDVLAYMDELYNASNIVVSVSGNMTVGDADALVRKYFLSDIRSNIIAKSQVNKQYAVSSFASKIKDFEQSNIAISYPSLTFDHPLSSAQAIFSILFGGGMSSRLFQKVREQMGLAYSVYSTQLSYVDDGSFLIMLNVTPANTEKALLAVKHEIAEIVRNGVTQEEFDKAKIQLKSALVFSEESIQNVMTRQGKLLLLTDKIYSVDDRMKDIDDVTLPMVNEFIRNTLVSEKVSAAYVGKEIKTDILSLIKEG